VPFAVAAAFVLARLPDLVRGRAPLSRVLPAVGNAWWSLGPAAVLCLTGVPEAAAPLAGVVALALVAQFAVDLAVSWVRERLDCGVRLPELLREMSSAYAVDAALTPAGLLAAIVAREEPAAGLLLVPLLGVLSVFSRERQARMRQFIELNDAYRGVAVVLGEVVEADDQYTGEHCKDVVTLALDVAERLGLDPQARRNLEFGALLHDVGKVVIPKDIINKPGRLDEEEWAIIRTHTIEGQRMLDRVGGFMSEVGLIVRSHHERWDGTGYPDRLAGTEIPIEARIIACCDTYNAMTTTRAYRPALSLVEARAELESCAGSQFDPVIASAVLEVVDRGGYRPSAAPQGALEPVA
jgi:putative nucleotidyltransferase with HDIG domain